MSVVCGPNSSLAAIVIDYYKQTPPRSLNESALNTSLDYVKTGITPVVEEIKIELVSIGYTIALMLIFITMFVVIALIMWVSYELKVSAYIVIVMLMTVIIIAIVSFYIIAERMIRNIEKTIDDTVSSLPNIITPSTVEDLTGIANSFANVYLTNLLVPSPCV